MSKLLEDRKRARLNPERVALWLYTLVLIRLTGTCVDVNSRLTLLRWGNGGNHLTSVQGVLPR